MPNIIQSLVDLSSQMSVGSTQMSRGVSGSGLLSNSSCLVNTHNHNAYKTFNLGKCSCLLVRPNLSVWLIGLRKKMKAQFIHISVKNWSYEKFEVAARSGCIRAVQKVSFCCDFVPKQSSLF